MEIKNNIIESVIKEKDVSEKSLHSFDELLQWINHRNKTIEVSLTKISLKDCEPWYYNSEEGCIRNEKGSFFKIFGMRQLDKNVTIVEQPIILQNEIGFLGIIASKINGVWHYLMQAKIEPGNVNVVQLSPTLQATKSNFTGMHGGSIPKYLEMFLNATPEKTIVDQIQSEQSSRFYKKRNRNVIITSDTILKETDSHRWMTLAQIKQFMKIDNLVNMDTRTVLSCIPYSLMGQDADVPFKDKPYFYKTAWNMNRGTIVELYNRINNYKMLSDIKTELVPLYEMNNWSMKEKEFSDGYISPFHIIFCDIVIEGREVSHWKQPLFASNGKADFGLFCCDDEGVLKFLVSVKPEPGCFDGVEIGPTIQKEYNSRVKNDIEKLYLEKLSKKDGVLVDTILSEEGGRFYQEENRNSIILVNKNEIDINNTGYIWSDYGTLNILTQVNNCLNIQLRNLLSLIEI